MRYDRIHFPKNTPEGLATHDQVLAALEPLTRRFNHSAPIRELPTAGRNPARSYTYPMARAIYRAFHGDPLMVTRLGYIDHETFELWLLANGIGITTIEAEVAHASR